MPAATAKKITVSDLAPEIQGHPIRYSYSNNKHKVTIPEDLNTVGTLFDFYLKPDAIKRGKGERGSFVPAVFSGKQRRREDAIEASFVALDIDGTATLSEARAKLMDAGFCCLIATATSHG